MPGRIDAILRAVSATPLAIMPEKLEEILGVLELRAQGLVASDGQVEEVMAARRARDERKIQPGNGVAVLPVFGTISRRIGGMSRSSGGFDLDDFNAAFDRAAADPDIGTIVLHLDSPGGAVPGVDESSRKIFEAREKKKIIAVADSVMASACYYIGSAAHEVIATPDALVGSIGVYLVHIDWSRFLANEGFKPTIIKAGEFKAEGHPYEPLADKAREHLQEEINDYYDLFISAVARNRGLSVATVRQEYGRGRAYLSKRALKMGMIDRIATLDDILEDLGVSRTRVREARAEEDLEVEIAAMDDFEESVSQAERTMVEVSREFKALDRRLLSGGGAHGSAHEDPYILLRGNGLPVGKAARLESESETTEENVITEEVVDAGGAAPAEAENPESGPAGAAISPPSTGDNEMSTVTTEAPATVATIGHDALAAERKRAADITALCSTHKRSEKASEYINAGLSVDAVSAVILRESGDTLESQATRAKPPVELSAKENQRYSVTRLLNAAAAHKAEQMAGFEVEISREISKKMGSEPRGFYVPTNLGTLPADRFRGVDQELERRAALTAGTQNEGKELVFIEPGSFIDMLRTRLVLARAGATFLPGLQGNVDFPKQTGAGVFSWVEEAPNSDDPADSDADTGLVSLRPKSGRSITSYSRTLLAQSVINVEQFVRRDLSAITARGIDRAGLHGTGSNNQPTGIYAASGVNSVAIDGAITYVKAVAMESEVAADNADIGAMKYVTTPRVRGAARTTQIFSGTNGQALWTSGLVRGPDGVLEGEMAGYGALVSNQVRSDLGSASPPNEHGIVFAVWDQLLIGEWGAIDVLVDPFTRAGRGLIRLVVFAIVDVALRQPEAFCKGTGLTAA